jgi:histidinol-phosphate aminotransferase
MLPASEVARLRAGLPGDVLLVLDAAYAEYVARPDYDPGTALVDAGTNTVMTRTFSKIFGMGGARLGWAYAPAPVAEILNRVRGPFNVNAPAMAAGIAALAEPGWVEKSVAHNAEWRGRLTESLRALGITVHPSEGNFILADFGTQARAVAAHEALRARGVIARAVAAYSLPQCLRITIGTAEECGMVEDALGAFARADG